ncbi:MAG: Uncharacterized protein XD97_0534 [Pelotomaculum thermopropionicum]|uniref:Uncharacterized protein n=1 Tax=Pelotomaculum thermopropionicum TaxID=110500 RepID=A0A101HRQ1_9FIRM|nr:MAG: Uncharacterized protein XD97_0534 [Pelotomaculum thermopropionicum]
MSNIILQPVDRNFPGAGSMGRDNLFYGLVEFIHILRHLGVRVSVAEARDAIDALSRVDLLARGQVKTALRAMLVKNHYDRKVFDLAFDAFFTAPEIRRERLEQRKERKGN